MSQSPPTTLGKYQIIREIARSNDIVYEAWDPLMNRRVALKELAMPGGATDAQREERRRRFEREAKAAGSLSHPNIVTIYEVDEDNGRDFIAMEYLDGSTLRQELDRNGFLPQDRCFDVILAVLEAIDFAHSRGVIHRDIKPENIQMLDSGGVKLTDFGIARLTFEPNITMDGQVFGTPSYMSPEQVLGKDIDARSDVFSAGVVFYEMLTGVKPFQGDNIVAITHAITSRTPEWLPQIPAPLWTIIGTALDKTPTMRYSSAREMIREITRVKSAPRQDPHAMPSVFGSSGQGQASPPTYPYNPFATQAAPPVYSAGAYTQQPYQAAPYAQTYPPGSYTQQPYGQAAGPYPDPNLPPYDPNLQAPLPVYYPPPPRGPLLSPGQRRFIFQLFSAFVVVGALVALALVGVQSLAVAIERYERERVPAGGSIRPEFNSRKSIELAGVMVEQGNLQGALGTLQTALRSDENNAELHERIGFVYSRLAGKNDELAVSSWLASAESYERAANLSGDEYRKADYSRFSGTAYLNAAQLAQANGDKAAALDFAYKARAVVPRGSDLAAKTDQFLEKLGR